MSVHQTILLLALLIGSSSCARPSASTGEQSSPTEEISFLSIVVDTDTAAADTRLKRFLEQAVAKGFKAESASHTVRFPQQTMPYGEVIRAFAERDPGQAYLARITPYAYVAAEMLGAKLDILAIYKSAATGETTYHSYFVVPKAKFIANTKWKPEAGDATLDDVGAYLKNLKNEPAKFLYHDRFSTSSYFLPSLYFKASNVFAMSHSLNPDLIPIQVERNPSPSSSDLITQVRKGKAHLAAVWDGTKNKFESSPDNAGGNPNEQVVFIKIPTAVPNDFLVASGISAATEARIVEAIKSDPGAGRICTSLKSGSTVANPAVKDRRDCKTVENVDDRPKDDFDAWYPWDGNDSEVPDSAKEALAKLRQDARQRPTPVVVKVEGKDRLVGGKEDPVLKTYVDAAKEAVRLSGTEFVLEDRDLHKRVDMTWTLESTHDGALKLTSTLDSAFGQSADEFAISFVDREDLPQRIADLVRSRLRRIRYIWPYEQKYPAVLRDLDFTPDHRVLVQRISWMDPARNEYEEDTPFVARIDNNTNFSKLRLSDEIKFPRSPDGSFNFDPMSNVAYRVVISREPQASWIWIVMPYSFIGLFVLACVGLAVDLRRQQPPPKGLHQTYQRMVEDYHRPWRSQELEEGEIVWTDPKYMDEFVKEIKTAGSFLDVVQAGGFDFNFGPLPVRFSILMKLATRLITHRPQLSSELIESSGASSAGALDALIQFLVSKRRLSPFVGFPEPNCGTEGRTPAWPIEWAALNDIASRHFQTLGISDKRIDADLGTQNLALSAVVSSHFRTVIKKATREASLFRQTWIVCEPGTPGRLVYEGEMRSPLLLRNENGAAPATSVRLQVTLPPEAVLSRLSAEPILKAWVFGKILSWSVEHGTLSLQVKPIAILKDYDHQL
jgi:ABC transporter, phosphonate, periplasmic substrate-binding protein